LASRIRLVQSRADNLSLNDPVDFILTFWVVHEIPNTLALMQEIRRLLKPTAHFLLVEPMIHVPLGRFQQIVETAKIAGLKPVREVSVRLQSNLDCYQELS